MTKRLTAKAIRHAMGQIKKGTSLSSVAVQIDVTPRHVRRLWAEFCATRSPHIPRMPGRPAIQAMDGMFMAGPGVFSSADIGEQFVVPFLKHESWDAGWVPSSIRCDGIYHTDVLGYIRWFEELRDSQSHDGDDLHPSELRRFILHPDRLLHSDPNWKIEYRDKISISLLSNVTSIEEERASGYRVLKNAYLFDTVYSFYNADPRTEMELSAWDIRDSVKNLEEGRLYFLHKSTTPYGRASVTAVESLENSYEIIRSIFSPENVRQVGLYNDARYFQPVLRDEIGQNPALNGKISARYSERYDSGGHDLRDFDRYEYQLYVKIYQMDQEVLDEWKAFLKKYGLEDAKTSYSIVLPISSFSKPPDETWRDYLIPTAKDQLGWGTPPFKILCEDMLHLVIVPDGTPACVTASEAREMLADGSAIMQVRPEVILNTDG